MPGHDLQGLVDRRAIAVLLVIPAYWEVRRAPALSEKLLRSLHSIPWGAAVYIHLPEHRCVSSTGRQSHSVPNPSLQLLLLNLLDLIQLHSVLASLAVAKAILEHNKRNQIAGHCQCFDI